MRLCPLAIGAEYPFDIARDAQSSRVDPLFVIVRIWILTESDSGTPQKHCGSSLCACSKIEYPAPCFTV